MTPLELYRQLLCELLEAREAAGGELSQAEEAERAGELDVVYWTLSDEDQETIEAALKEHRAGGSPEPQ
jgi:hypothetical protein